MSKRESERDRDRESVRRKGGHENITRKGYLVNYDTKIQRV